MAYSVGLCSWGSLSVGRRRQYSDLEYMTSLSPSQPLYDNSWLDSFYIEKLVGDDESTYSLAHPGTYG